MGIPQDFSITRVFFLELYKPFIEEYALNHNKKFNLI